MDICSDSLYIIYMIGFVSESRFYATGGKVNAPGFAKTAGVKLHVSCIRSLQFL